ncbi:Ribosome biogenesis protein brx1 [Cryptotrichosporon argae]
MSMLKATAELAKAKGKKRADPSASAVSTSAGGGAAASGSASASADATGAGADAPADKRRKDKVLLLSSRGVTQRMRHLINDLEALLPHVKKDSKLDSKSSLHLINELADLHSCNNALYFEARRHEDLYLWLARTPNGPSVKCHVQNVHTMDELKMTGNCLKGSRGVVVFDGRWDAREEHRLLKEMFSHIFSVPRTSRRLKPFIDHILLFSLLDNRIWFRVFQIIEKDPLNPNAPASSASLSASASASLSGASGKKSGKTGKAGAPVTSLVEIGPRFVLSPIRIFEGSMGGPTVFANEEYVSPAATRASAKRAQGDKYRARKATQQDREDRRKRHRDDVGDDELARARVFA